MDDAQVSDQAARAFAGFRFGGRFSDVDAPASQPQIDGRNQSAGISVRRLIAAVCLALVVAACASPPASPSTTLHSGILIVAVGEMVQPAPNTEALAVAFSDALVLGEASGADVGYPSIDRSSGELILSAATSRGRSLIDAAGITVPHRIRDVSHGAAELRRIQDDVTFLGSRGVAGAELIYATGPDYRDNRALIVMSANSGPLLDYLAAHYPVDALAVQIDPTRGGGSP